MRVYVRFTLIYILVILLKRNTASLSNYFYFILFIHFIWQFLNEYSSVIFDIFAVVSNVISSVISGSDSFFHNASLEKETCSIFFEREVEKTPKLNVWSRIRRLSKTFTLIYNLCVC